MQSIMQLMQSIIPSTIHHSKQNINPPQPPIA